MELLFFVQFYVSQQDNEENQTFGSLNNEK